jgi:hypothetical protein
MPGSMTVCPATPTQCPPQFTRCPPLQTRCPEVRTQCPPPSPGTVCVLAAPGEDSLEANELVSAPADGAALALVRVPFSVN